MVKNAAKAESASVPNPTEASSASPVSTEAVLIVEAQVTVTPSPTLAAVAPTATPTTIPPTPTPALAATETPTTVPDTATPTPAPSASCNTSVPSRLGVGQQAQVVKRLNMLSQASIDAAILQTNPTRTQVEIIGGPVCTPVGERAYLWWQIRLPGGAEGWAAESQLNQASYLLEPLP